MGYTKEERREYDRAWRERNREKMRDQAKARYAADPEKHKAKQKAYRERHPDRYAEQKELARQRMAAKPLEDRAAYNREWRRKNRERCNEWKRNHYHSWDDKRKRVFIQMTGLRRRTSGKIRSSALAALLDRYVGCAYCASTDGLEIHHLVPVRLGGINKVQNLVPLCDACHVAIHRAYRK